MPCNALKSTQLRWLKSNQLRWDGIHKQPQTKFNVDMIIYLIYIGRLEIEYVEDMSYFHRTYQDSTTRLVSLFLFVLLLPYLPFPEEEEDRVPYG
mmetsp:Transcript_55698/g.62254  ORF Transcript_55698/g.62254 Transcript_55698/m.62254 type:complete len:95 (+) Transcript_55698:330-614(+)